MKVWKMRMMKFVKLVTLYTLMFVFWILRGGNSKAVHRLLRNLRFNKSILHLLGKICSKILDGLRSHVWISVKVLLTRAPSMLRHNLFND